MWTRLWSVCGIAGWAAVIGGCAKPATRVETIVTAPATLGITDCIGNPSFDVDTAIGSDPHGQGELLGVGFRVRNDPELVRVDRIRMATATLGGQPVTHVVVRAHALEGDGPAGRLTGALWVGVSFVGSLHCTSPGHVGEVVDVTVRIADATLRNVDEVDSPTPPGPRPPGPAPQKWVYRLELDLGGTHQHVAGCGRQPDNHVIPIPGHWDSTGVYVAVDQELSFACLQAGAPLCLRWGTSDDPAALPDGRYQACSRMVRADYCGTGRMHTLEGTFVGYLAKGDDGVSSNDPHHFEGAWGPNGQLCRDHLRWPANDETCKDGRAPYPCSSWRQIQEDLDHVFVNGSCVDPSRPPANVKCTESAPRAASGGEHRSAITHVRDGGGRAAMRP